MDTCNGWNFDLRLKHTDGTTYFSPGGEYPVDIAFIGSQAADGTYKVIVLNGFAGSTPAYNPLWTGSQASVQIYNGAAPLAASLGGGLKRVPSTCGTNAFWYVGDLTKSGTSYTWTNNENLCTNTPP